MRIYYFGCVGEVGHFMHTPDLSIDWEFMRTNPWAPELDDAFKGLQHKDGWTALAMHDYTVDQRPGSNSIFLAEGEFDESQMVELAYEHFPDIAERVGLARSRRKTEAK